MLLTRIRQIIRFMNELGLGFDRTALPLPTETMYLPAVGIASGRTIAFPVVDDGEEDFSALPSRPWLWVPTLEPTPSRWYPARTKGHSRGTVTNPLTRKAITFSSTHEMNLAYMLSSSRHIELVEDQPAATPVPHEDGGFLHTIDYRATLKNTGYRIAAAVRPRWLIENDDLDDTVYRIDSAAPDQFSDGAVIMTELEASNSRGWNGKSILRALKYSTKDDNDRLRDYAARFDGAVSLIDLTRKFDNPALATNAVWCLIYEGYLDPVRKDLKLVDAPFVRFVQTPENPVTIH